MAGRPYVWQMVREAVTQSGPTPISYGQIRDYIASHYGPVNPSTINCQIICCSVNHPSRIHFPENSKPRLCDTPHDFLFYLERGKVELYDPRKHGRWLIEKGGSGRLRVLRSGSEENKGFSPVPEKAEMSGSSRGGRKTAVCDISRPCEKELKDYLEKWDGLEKYTAQEDALNKLFLRIYPRNTEMDEILIKAAALNDFYSTNIFAVFPVARHIHQLGIDDRLAAGDESLVNEIALLKMEDGREKNFYSFASKYCSHHNAPDYPIYDSHVERVLKYFRAADGFAVFSDADLRDFSSFKKILRDFRDFYGLQSYGYKDIDRYLWQLGKDKFPKNHKKKQT